jgi:flagellar biosynthesis protein FlhF
MKLKSFFANSIEEAIRQAREALGSDAMLVNSKRSGLEAQHLGLYEVVVCGEAEERGASKTQGQAHGPESVPPRGAPLPVDRLSHDVAEIKQQMEKLALTLGRSARGMASSAFDPALSRVFTTLTDAELDTDLAYDLVGRLASSVSGAGLRQELAKLVNVDTELGVPGAPARVIALVGPPGAGKTSALVKLAVQYGLAAGQPVQVLTTDTFRIAAAEELRSYAAILGIRCQVLETPTALSQALPQWDKPAGCDKPSEPDQHDRRSSILAPPRSLILIDTPGLCHSELAASEDLAALLASHPAVDTHLVLPASMRASDMRRLSEQYDIFRPRKLLFTRLDETETFGPILSRSVRLGRPVSFLTRGQRIPEDLEPATSDLLLDLILGPLALQATQNEVKEAMEYHPKFDVAAAGKHAA